MDAARSLSISSSCSATMTMNGRSPMFFAHCSVLFSRFAAACSLSTSKVREKPVHISAP